MNKKVVFYVSALLILLYVIFTEEKGMFPFIVPFVFGHCNTMDGQVIKDAQKALKDKDVSKVLRWVKKEDEEIIKESFKKTLAVRVLNKDAREVADMSFFETLVRIHRAGEGEPYTGIEPAGIIVDPGIKAADEAVERGSVENLINDITAHITYNIKERYNTLVEKKKSADQSVEAGREYVNAYVAFIHYVENLLQKMAGHGHHH